MSRPLFISSSTTPIPFDTHLLLLCEMLSAVDEENPSTPQAEASADAA